MVRAARPSPRRVRIDPDEVAYLRERWGLLSKLMSALRTEPNVCLAVLYGSVARGDDRAGSDVDVLVDFRDDEGASVAALATRLSEALDGRPGDVARLSRVRREAPLLLRQALDEGRVLVDRDDQWNAWRMRRESVARNARRHSARQRAAAARALDELLEGS